MFTASMALSIPAVAGPIITLQIGRPGHDCTGFGICKLTIGRSSDIQSAIAARATLAGNKLTFAFNSMPREHGDTLPIDSPLEVQAEVARALGVGSLVILPGQYAVDYRSNPNGTVTVDTRSTGIVVVLDIGRKKLGCTGFGICKITVGNETASTQQLPATATSNGDGLTIDLLGSTREHGDLLVIDEDIMLDEAGALAFGHKHLRILAGEYRVDYSANPNGTVNVATVSNDFVVVLDIGRKKLGCTGFGICKITVGNEAIGSQALAAATVRGGVLTLDLLQQTREHGDLLVIDEDIPLDARALSIVHKDLAARRGEYRVDYSTNPNGTVQIPLVSNDFVVVLDIGRKKLGCTGFGICKITVGNETIGSQALAAATITRGGLRLDLLQPAGERNDMLVIDEDIMLDSGTAIGLGSRGMKIRAGSYPVDYSANPNGTVTVGTMRNDFVIEVQIGRASRSCSGLGICKIVIGLEGSSGNNALASLAGNTLDVLFTKEMPEPGDMMTIDDDIELDPQLARMLGAKSLTIRKGVYGLTHNEDGTTGVKLDVARIGIGVTIRIGRPNRNCTGFGICSIEINLFDAPSSAYRGIAVAEGGTLTVDLLDSSAGQDSVLHIDEAFELDSAVAAALGVTTIVPGDYPVDYSANPNGTVNLLTRSAQQSGVDADESAISFTATARPNPTAGTTMINFPVRRGGAVSITLTDATGRQVATILENRNMAAGMGSVNFDASALPSGIYFYTVRSASGVETGSMVVAR